VSAEADPRDRHAHPDGDLLLGQPAPLAHPGQPPAAGIVQHRGDGRAESLLTAGALDPSGSGEPYL
jgi:hypothetical protein